MDGQTKDKKPNKGPSFGHAGSYKVLKKPRENHFTNPPPLVAFRDVV